VDKIWMNNFSYIMHLNIHADKLWQIEVYFMVSKTEYFVPYSGGKK
jgi:hypothetical protein